MGILDNSLVHGPFGTGVYPPRNPRIVLSLGKEKAFPSFSLWGIRLVHVFAFRCFPASISCTRSSVQTLGNGQNQAGSSLGIEPLLRPLRPSKHWFITFLLKPTGSQFLDKRQFWLCRWWITGFISFLWGCVEIIAITRLLELLSPDTQLLLDHRVSPTPASYWFELASTPEWVISLTIWKSLHQIRSCLVRKYAAPKHGLI